jgi:hypothetical protein
MSRRPFYVRYRGWLISFSAVVIAMLSAAMVVFGTDHILPKIVLVSMFPLCLVGGVIHFIDMFRTLHNGPDDML